MEALIKDTLATEIIMAKLKSYTVKKQTLFFEKLLENSDKSTILNNLMLYVNDPKKYIYKEHKQHGLDAIKSKNMADLKIGNTVYLKKDIHWSSELKRQTEAGNIIENTFCLATIVDFNFNPFQQIIVRLHGTSNDTELSKVSSNNIVNLDLI